jgi:hypothetical protein
MLRNIPVGQRHHQPDERRLAAKPLAVQKIEDGRFELVASRCITKD